MLNRLSEHKLLRARQGGLGGLFGNDNGNDGGDTASASSEPPQSSTAAASSQPASQSSASPSTTAVTERTTTTLSPTSSQAPSTSVPPSTTQRASSTTTSTSSSSPSSSIVSSSSPSSSIISTSSRSTTRSTTSSSTTVAGFAKTSLIVSTDDASATSSFRSVTRTSASFGEGSTVSASNTPTVSGAINTGAVVGGIAGGLVALAALGFIICFFMRRRSRRRRADEFSASQFRRSAMIMPDDHFASNSPASPIVPQMYERGHTVAPSVTSMTGPGVAGQGAVYYNQSQAQNPQDFRNQYSDHPYATSPPPRNQAQPLQERPQYTFGQPDNNYQPNVMSDDGHGNYESHGAYSSEPQMQMAYNAEDYSGYHAYSPDTAQGYAGAHPGYTDAGGHAGYAGAHARTKSSNTLADSEDAYGGI
ncbi:hypothetical protein CPB85DRAFT_1435608 [Mucidula mucida]|nr:hypothetical protein CPB85DRAFT_1435608 [Mucidula mucida]